MKWIQENFMWLVIIAIIATSSGFFFKSAKDAERELISVNGKYYELLSHTADTVYVDKIVTEIRKGDDIPVIVRVPVEVYIPADVDTMAILEDYYTTRIYTDTLSVEDLGYVSLTDTISQNRIVARYYTANISERTITETIIVKELPKFQFWGGVTTSTNMSLGGSLAMITPSQRHYGLDVGIYQGEDKLVPYVGFRYLWRIR